MVINEGAAVIVRKSGLLSVGQSLPGDEHFLRMFLQLLFALQQALWWAFLNWLRELSAHGFCPFLVFVSQGVHLGHAHF